jgi:hypothetical protein
VCPRTLHHWDQIGSLLDDPDADAVASLTAQKERILEKVARLADLDRGVDRMIEAHRGGVLLTTEQQREIFGDGRDPDWTRQAHEKRGAHPPMVRVRRARGAAFAGTAGAAAGRDG